MLDSSATERGLVMIGPTRKKARTKYGGGEYGASAGWRGLARSLICTDILLGAAEIESLDTALEQISSRRR